MQDTGPLSIKNINNQMVLVIHKPPFWCYILQQGHVQGGGHWAMALPSGVQILH